jgi:hypothetical protein
MLWSNLKTKRWVTKNNRILEPALSTADKDMLDRAVSLNPGPVIFNITELGADLRRQVEERFMVRDGAITVATDMGVSTVDGFVDLKMAVEEYTKSNIPVRPPYDVTWFECTAHLGFLEGWLHSSGFAESPTGCLVLHGPYGGTGSIISSWERETMPETKDGGMCLRIIPYIHLENSVAPLGAHVLVLLDKDGYMVRGGTQARATEESLNKFLDVFPAARMPGDTTFLRDVISEAATLSALPVLRALALLNCKNVAAEPHPFARGVKSGKKHGRGPLARAIYHTLVLTLPGRAGGTVGASTHTGLERAQHLVRGHFADYRDGSGLFGRVHGMFWIPAHVRGNKDAGVVTKQYEVKAAGKINRE